MEVGHFWEGEGENIYRRVKGIMGYSDMTWGEGALFRRKKGG